MPANSVREVFLWYPNLIGYVRVLCMAASFYFLWEKEPYRFLAFYMAAFAGDLVDGYVARAFKQESKFGAVLDMVTDRVSTAGMVMCMIPLLKDEHKTFGVSDQKWAVFLVILDIASHWFHVQSVSAHHKSKDATAGRNALLQWYYSIYPLFAYCCVGAELFYIFYYLNLCGIKVLGPLPVYEVMTFVCAPGFIIKQVVNVVQLTSAAEALASLDVASKDEKKK